MLPWKLSVLEISLDKELTANCLVETRTKLEELIPAAMAEYGLNRVQLPLWVQHFDFNKIMHLRFNFDACLMHSPFGFVYLTYQNLSTRVLVCHNSLA